MTDESESLPPRGSAHYQIYCPSCKREGVMAGWRYFLTNKPVPPENLTCPECGTKVEVIGRVDQ